MYERDLFRLVIFLVKGYQKVILSFQAANMSSAQKLRAMLVGGAEPTAPVVQTPPVSRLSLPAQPPRADDDNFEPSDVVRLGEEGWKQRYYLNKFAVVVDEDVNFQQQLVRAYVEGLSWVLAYYYQGVCKLCFIIPTHNVEFHFS